jgi:hypothetical protein
VLDKKDVTNNFLIVACFYGVDKHAAIHQIRFEGFPTFGPSAPKQLKIKGAELGATEVTKHLTRL